MDEWKHIGDSSCFSNPVFYWADIPENTDIEVELINFFKSKPIESNEGCHHDFAAYCTEDIPKMELFKGDIIKIGFPYRTLFRALQPIAWRARITRQIGNDNVLVRFRKLNKKALKIIHIERRAEDSDMSQKADMLVYSVKPDYPKAERRY